MGCAACQAHPQRARVLPYREMGLKIVTAWCWWASDGPKSKEQINAPLEVTSGEACSVPFRFVQGTGWVGGPSRVAASHPPTQGCFMGGMHHPSWQMNAVCIGRGPVTRAAGLSPFTSTNFLPRGKKGQRGGGNSLWCLQILWACWSVPCWRAGLQRDNIVFYCGFRFPLSITRFAIKT